MEKKTYCFDLDGTLCTVHRTRHYLPGKSPDKVYELAQPFVDRVELVNEIYDAGHTVLIDTARGTGHDNVKQWEEMTKKQLEEWGVKYHQLRVGVKLVADKYVDDRGSSDINFFLQPGKIEEDNQ